MVNIKKHLRNALKPTNIPCYLATNFDSTEDMYFVFFIDRTSTANVTDDEEEAIKHEITLYLYSKVDYDDVAFETLKLLKENGFRRIFEAEDYDNETKYYTKAIKIEYVDYL